MQKKCFLILSIFLMFILSSCNITDESKSEHTKSDTSQQKFQDDSDEIYYSVSHGFTSEEREFIFDGEHPVTIPYFIKNGQLDSEIGLCIYINGVQQLYTLDVQPEQSLMHIFSFSPSEGKEFEIKFIPNIGQKGDVLSVNICTMLNPNYMLSNTNNVNFLPNHNLSSNTAVKLIMNEASVQTKTNNLESSKNYTTSQINSELKESFIRKDDEENTERNMLDTITFYYIYQRNYDDGLLEVKDDIFSGNVDILGKPGKYRVSIYYNHTLVPDAFNGLPFLDVELEKDNVITCNVQFKVDTTKKLNHIYIIATPIPEVFDEHTQVEKTKTKLVEVQQ